MYYILRTFGEICRVSTADSRVSSTEGISAGQARSRELIFGHKKTLCLHNLWRPSVRFYLLHSNPLLFPPLNSNRDNYAI